MRPKSAEYGRGAAAAPEGDDVIKKLDIVPSEFFVRPPSRARRVCRWPVCEHSEADWAPMGALINGLSIFVEHQQAMCIRGDNLHAIALHAPFDLGQLDSPEVAVARLASAPITRWLLSQVLRRHEKLPSNWRLSRRVSVMILGGQLVKFCRADFFSTASADIDARVRRWRSRRMDFIKYRHLLLMHFCRVLVQGHHVS
jgi:hypothetical protein